jgi:hypothetical protein
MRTRQLYGIMLVSIAIIFVMSWLNTQLASHHLEGFRNNSSQLKYVVVTPAGRREYLENLFAHMKKQKSTYNEWHLWMNTQKTDDIEYMERLASENEWVKLKYHPKSDPSKGNMNIFKFFDYAVDPNTVYLRLDDDIVWLEDGFISNMFKQRLAHPENFLVFANIINNGIITHMHQRSGAFVLEDKIVDFSSGGNGWNDVDIVTRLHNAFIEDVKSGNLDKWKKSFNTWVAEDYPRISINAISWFGEEMRKVDRNLIVDEEQYLSSDYPKEVRKPNIIVGQPVCVHYAFYTQREHLDTTNILAKYRELAGLDSS